MDVIVRHEPERNRHVALTAADEREVGFVVDHVSDGRHMLVHTEVADGVEGQGVASSLVGQVLDAIRRESEVIVPRCPFVRGYIERNPEYEALVVDEQSTATGGS